MPVKFYMMWLKFIFDLLDLPTLTCSGQCSL